MISIFAFQAGSARALVPVIHRWRESRRGHFFIVAYPQAAGVFREAGLECVEAAGNGMEVFVEGPELLLTGTSWQPEIESALWQKAAERGIPSLAILDNWNSVSRRFTAPVGGAAYNSLPDRVAVMDEFTRAAMVEAGCPSGCVRVTGQPALDGFSNPEAFSRMAARERLGVEMEKPILLFVSEALQTFFGESGELDVRFGYDDEVVLADVLEALSEPEAERFSMVVKLHPAETVDRASPVLARYPDISSRVVRESGQDWAAAANLVVGTTSILLLEAALMGRKVCSHRPNARSGSPMLEANRGRITETRTGGELRAWLNGADRIPGNAARAKVADSAAENVCVLMETLIFQSRPTPVDR